VMTCSILSAIIAAVAANKKILKSRLENEVKARCSRGCGRGEWMSAVNGLVYLDGVGIYVDCSGKLIRLLNCRRTSVESVDIR
jgi:hypothetical protein